jgi:tripeptidyl-peptidase-1
MRSSRAAEASGDPVKALSSRDEYVEPSLLRSLYNTMGYAPAAAGWNVLGVAGLVGQYPSPDDLRVFMDEFRTDGEDATYSVISINGGGYDRNSPTLEGDQNIQYAAAMTYPTPLIYYTMGGRFLKDDPFLNWLNFLLMQQSIPQTISISYGASEYYVPTEFATTLCYQFMRLGARGVSVLVSSGDDGVGSGDCKDVLGNFRFRPFFPATCTWEYISA